MATSKKLDRMSRALTKILRHSALERGLAMTVDGMVSVGDILTLPEFRGATEEDIRTIVRACRKQRFHLDEGDTDSGKPLRIGANQGHTIGIVDPHAMMEPLTAERLAHFPTVVHGTYRDAWSKIQSLGLSPMRRQHIHLATALPKEEGVISGMRASSQVLIYIDVAAAMADGVPFFVSRNGVILTPGHPDTSVLSPKYFSNVVML
eukprot:m.182094 g.182094  ORF g.182094 m.182094 type:complete len:206 (-) comp15437_c0_seq1:1379-1996(-)